MTLSARLVAFSQAVGADIKNLTARIAVTTGQKFPTAPSRGDRYFHTVYNCTMEYNGTSWRQVDIATASILSLRTQMSNATWRSGLHTGFMCIQEDTGTLYTWIVGAAGYGWYSMNTYVPPQGTVGTMGPVNIVTPTVSPYTASQITVPVRVDRLYQVAWSTTGPSTGTTASYFQQSRAYVGASQVGVTATRVQNVGAKSGSHIYSAGLTGNAVFGMLFDTSTMGVLGFSQTVYDLGDVNDPQTAFLKDSATYGVINSI